MQVNELKIPGAYEFVPPRFPDNRGLFTAPFQGAEFQKHLGFPLTLAQVIDLAGNTALLEEINGAIADARADGTYNTIYEKWFGRAPAAN